MELLVNPRDKLDYYFFLIKVGGGWEYFMKWIEEKRGDHAGDIWIIGAHPILMQYLDNFFDDKISIALNFSFVAFPKSTYICTYHQKVLDLLLQYKPEFLRKCIVHWPLEMPNSLEKLGKYKDWPTYMKSATRHTGTELIASVEAIIEKKPTTYFNISDICHVAIQAAAVMGAKRIILAACLHKATKQFFRAQSRGMWLFYPETRGPHSASPGTFYSDDQIMGAWKLGELFRNYQLGTNTLAQALRKHGIEVLRHYPPPEERLEKVVANGE